MAKQPVTPLEALKALMDLIGDRDLPDNGELSGAAICDMARAAIVSTEKQPRPLECSTCGEKHKYDQVRGWGCLVLLDDREIPNTVLGAWCSEACLVDWLETKEAKTLLAPGM